MSDVTAEYIDKFWELIDEILNAVLFVGLELLIIKRTKIVLASIILLFLTLVT
jgi:CPA1 family monovalent cation:H+ antiporter